MTKDHNIPPHTVAVYTANMIYDPHAPKGEVASSIYCTTNINDLKQGYKDGIISAIQIVSKINMNPDILKALIDEYIKLENFKG